MDKGNPLLVDTGSGFSVSYKGRYLYNSTEPIKGAQMRANKMVLKKQTLYILNSPLLYYGVPEILSRLPDDSHIICIELSADLDLLSQSHIPAEVSNSSMITIVSYDNSMSTPNLITELVSNLVTEMGIWRFRRVEAITLSGGYILFPGQYKDILNLIDSRIKEYWKNRMTLIYMGPLWIKNIFLNLFKFYNNGKAELLQFNPETELPVIVTGAGESLEGSVSFIRENRDSYKILSVDTAVSILLENGIIPDYIIAEDAQIYNLYDFMSVKNKKIPLIFDLTGYTGIPNVMRGPVFPFLSLFKDVQLFKRLGHFNLMPMTVPPLGSVGITAVYLALLMTRNNILYTGLDFAYQIGKSHANGSPRNISELSNSNRIKPMEQPDIYYKRSIIQNRNKLGEPCITDIVLSSYASIMSDLSKQNDRLFDLGFRELPAEEMSRDSDYSNSEPKDGPEKQPFQYNQIKSDKLSLDNFKPFLQSELVLLNEVYDSTYAHLSGSSNAPAVLIELLKDVDYIYMHFPDNSPEPSLDSGYLKRILISCGYYIKMLEKYIEKKNEDCSQQQAD